MYAKEILFKITLALNFPIEFVGESLLEHSSLLGKTCTAYIRISNYLEGFIGDVSNLVAA